MRVKCPTRCSRLEVDWASGPLSVGSTPLRFSSTPPRASLCPNLTSKSKAQKGNNLVWHTKVFIKISIEHFCFINLLLLIC